MPSSTLTSKGQVTIPKEIREYLKVRNGDRLDFIVDAEGKVILRPGTRDVRELRGILSRRGKRPVTLEEMEAAILRRGAGPHR